MSDSNTSGATALITPATESAAKKVGEKAVDRGLNAIIDFVKSKFGETQVKIGVVFDRYLENATQRYNQMTPFIVPTTTKTKVVTNVIFSARR